MGAGPNLPSTNLTVAGERQHSFGGDDVTSISGAGGARGQSTLGALICITALFFIWAFVTNLIDPLVKSMKVIYALGDGEAQLTQFAFFIGYGLTSVPAAALLARVGYAQAILIGLAGIVLGCLVAWSTGITHTYLTVLAGLFIAASGIALLQVAANPLIAAMGDPKSSHVRLNFAQGFNSLGAFLGGVVGAVFLLKGPLFDTSAVVTDAMKATGLSFVTSTYLELALALALFTALVFLVRRAIRNHAPQVSRTQVSPLAALRSRWANLGALGIFVYVGAEVCVLSGMIFFLEQKQILNVPSQAAGIVGPIFMLFAMVGRFFGSWLMTRIPAPRLLAVCAAAAAVLCGIVIATYHMAATPLSGSLPIPTFPGVYHAALTTGFLPGFAAILIGLFNSIMFPTIFTITLERSSAPASATSGLMCMAISGGGFVSVAYGATVDQLMHAVPVGARSLAFAVPLACYLYILWFSRTAERAPTHQIEEGVAAPH